MIVTTDAVVLQTRRFRESSKIVTLYTRELGLTSVVARGVMQPKSQSGAVLQPMGHISVVIYLKEGRDLQNLSSAEEKERYGRLLEDLERMSAGLAIVELVKASMHDAERNEPLFEALVDSLRMLNRPETVAQNVVLWFIARLAALLGYALATEHCGVCHQSVGVGESVPFSVAVGAPLCNDDRDSAGYVPLRREIYELLRSVCNRPLPEVAAMPSSQQSRTAVLELLTSFIRYHVDGLRRLNVNHVALKLLGDAGSAGG